MASLFYHCGALGDFLSILPVVRAWRLAFPRERAVLLGKPAQAAVMGQEGCFDEVRDVESREYAWLFSNSPRVDERQRAHFSSFDTAVVFAASGSPVCARLSAAGVRNILSQSPFPPRRMSAIEYHLTLFPGLSGILDHFGPIVLPDPAYEKEANSLVRGMEDFILIHPGSGSGMKNWPIERFKLFSEKCARRGLAAVWICGEAENDISFPDGSHVVRKPLPVLVHLFKRCRAYIGNDSGISHLASAAGCRSTVLFGPSDHAVWGPRGARVTIIKARRACAACHPARDATPRCGESCMLRLSVDEVFDGFLRTLG
jgi:heptosyltransferase III